MRVKPGDVVRLELPWSEVCMHLKVAGQVRDVRVLHTSAQILNEDGTPYSFPVTHGEAGIYTDAEGLYINLTVNDLPGGVNNPHPGIPAERHTNQKE